MPDLTFTQNNQIDKGTLKVGVVERRGNTPIRDATINISYTGEPNSTIEEVNTNASGMSEELTLDAPPLEYSMEPSENQPFAQYTVRITAPGYRPITISGVQIFPGELALQNVRMEKKVRQVTRLIR